MNEINEIPIAYFAFQMVFEFYSQLHKSSITYITYEENYLH